MGKKKNQMPPKHDVHAPLRRSGRKKGRRNHVNGKSANDAKLRETVEGDGERTIIDMAADGNCLFRSLSDQLYHDFGNNHELVRREVCDYLAGHESEFSAFLVLDDEDEDASDFTTYVETMRRDGEWGGNLELVVASRLYRRNIAVFSASLAAFTIEHGSTEPSAGPDLLVSYHDNDHYNSVRSNSLSKPPPPIRTYTKGDSSEDASTDPMVTEEEELESSEAAEEQPPVKPTERVKKNDPCPCGSKLRYKKCCLAKEKHAARVHRMRQGLTDDPEPEEPSMDGDFRVLKI